MYNIDSIISELANGKSEGDIAKELSDMLNAAVAQKKQKDAEEAAARQKAQEEKTQKDIAFVAESMVECLVEYLRIVDCHNMVKYLDEQWDEACQEIVELLTNLRTVMPFYDKIFAQQMKEVKSTKAAEKGNAKFAVTLDNKGSTEYSDRMAEEVLKDFLRQIGK